ncbi:hypothetical protein ABZX92_32830 [Lentzea sp. NPDC006480]|uniref:hypothetical protein n=1 Tax=Lentzea sp. NPDC006480 TaxID=3157176 RepID=UPI0033B01D22
MVSRYALIAATHFSSRAVVNLSASRSLRAFTASASLASARTLSCPISWVLASISPPWATEAFTVM